MSRSVRRQRLLAIIAAFAMVTVICGFTTHGFSADTSGSGHCDWTIHCTGLAGSAPHPVPVIKPVLAGWRLPPVAQAALRSARRVRAYLARAPPPQLSIG